jgi:hypothetical protein
MASTEERQETVDALKGRRYYRLSLSGYGGEAAYIKLTKEAFDFWNNVCDEYGDSDLVNYCVTDDPEDYDFDDIDGVPEEADFLTEDDFKSQWYEAPTEEIHQYGVSYDSAYLTVEEVDGDGWGSSFVADVIEGEEVSSFIDRIGEETDWEVEQVEGDEDMGPDDMEYVLQFYSAEKGGFWDGVIETYGDFDPKKLKFVTTEYPNGEDVITEVKYDDQEVDNNGGDTNGKGYSAYVWANE